MVLRAAGHVNRNDEKKTSKRFDNSKPMKCPSYWSCCSIPETYHSYHDFSVFAGMLALLQSWLLQSQQWQQMVGRWVRRQPGAFWPQNTCAQRYTPAGYMTRVCRRTRQRANWKWNFDRPKAPKAAGQPTKAPQHLNKTIQPCSRQADRRASSGLNGELRKGNRRRRS